MEVDKEYLDLIISTIQKHDEKVETLIRVLESKGDNVLVSCSEAARLLGVSATTITAMLKQNRLHKVRIGKSTGIRLSEIRSTNNSQ